MSVECSCVAELASLLPSRDTVLFAVPFFLLFWALSNGLQRVIFHWSDRKFGAQKKEKPDRDHMEPPSSASRDKPEAPSVGTSDATSSPASPNDGNENMS
ncbi:hypothetical protein BJX61DRAFT_541364 [Aspergillus egyptiacus]|nr:hypothetical protein BJX61DRAFT_541364 [Aspergillus egyptiacus]